MRIRNVGGDGIYLAAAHVGSGVRWAGPVRLHHSVIDGTGRSGISIADGAKGVTIDHNKFRHIAFYTLNIEPNGMVWDGVAAGARAVKLLAQLPWQAAATAPARASSPSATCSW